MDDVTVGERKCSHVFSRQGGAGAADGSELYGAKPSRTDEGKKIVLAISSPRPNAIPVPVGAWSDVGRRGSVLPSPPCLRSWVWSPCLYLVLVAVLLCGLLGVSASWFSAETARCCQKATLEQPGFRWFRKNSQPPNFDGGGSDSRNAEAKKRTAWD